MVSVLLFGQLTFACKKNTKTAPPPPPPVIEEPAPVLAPDPAPPIEVKELVANFQRVYFDYDASELSADARQALSQNAEILQRKSNIRVEVQGHADQRGSTEYNLALGERRADSVVQHLIASGITSNRLKTVSYGEERPLSQVDSEQAWSKDRRCEFVIVWGGEPAATTPTNLDPSDSVEEQAE